VLLTERAAVDLATLATGDLAERGAAEQARFRQGQAADERASLELFRRAIEERDEHAWERLYQQWRGLLVHWLLQHPTARLVLEDEDSDSYLAAAWSRFWQATTGATRSQPRFESLAGILSYLRRCLNCAVLDAARQIRARQREAAMALLVEERGAQLDLSGGELWRCIELALPDARERQLVYLRYVLGYRPREVAALYPAEFAQVERVYQREHLILERLRRHPRLARWRG
jgi:DNA-directed RNA polymerase specialized sigma24 family protein